MDSINLAISALREMKQHVRYNAIAYYTSDEVLPETSPINEMLNAGYVVRIPYWQPEQERKKR
jgi:hypothetical protein